MKNIKEEITELFYDFYYEVDSDHGDISLDIGILKYRKILLEAIEKMVERVVGEDENEIIVWESKQAVENWEIDIRNQFRQQLREKFKKELINSEREK